MAYIMKGGEKNMNGGLSKSKKKTGTLDFGGNPSPPCGLNLYIYIYIFKISLRVFSDLY